MRQARVFLDRNFTIGRIDPRLFGAFIEHLGRGVYSGIYEPGHPTADEKGFRRDVLDLVRELGVTIVKYPGGNFVSTYNWEDGVGPVEERPRRLSYVWASLEPNTFGTNEFIAWCRLAGVEPMLVVNLATRGPQDAANLVEYCNVPGGTTLSDLRRAHGFDKPHGVKFWCLGGEMDGVWHAGATTADEYGRIAAQAGKIMRWVDDSIELAVSGSSGPYIPTLGSWDETVLHHALDHVEWIALHTYLNNWKDDPPALLAAADLIDAFIEGVIAVADAVAAKRRSSKRIMVSFNEWNVWYRTRRPYEHLRMPGWPVAPPLLEEVYSVEDALMVGGVLISFLNHADRVRSACLAELVNVIAPISTETGGPAWRQTIFYPFAQVSRLARGDVLRVRVECESYAAACYNPYRRETFDQLPSVAYLKASAVANEGGGLTLLALNRDLDQEMTVLVSARGFGRLAVAEATVLTDSDLKAANTKAALMRVKPARLSGVAVGAGTVRMELPPASWSVVHLRVAA
ncbi:MAG: alpha-N-arabinofuranosidase [Hyphomicrobiales bacterium]|nr:alpha-N-arabinofuranosidase [Hyphomicrobiales bacterium]